MRRLISVVLVLAVCVIALGFYQGWFGLSTSRDATDGKTDIKVRIDEKKFESDTEKAKEKVKDVFDGTTGKPEGK